MTLRRSIRRANILVGTTVAAIVFVLSVTGVVLIYELGVDAQAQRGDYRASHFGRGAEPGAALAGRGRHASGQTASTLVPAVRRAVPVSVPRADAVDGGCASGRVVLDSGGRDRRAGSTLGTSAALKRRMARDSNWEHRHRREDYMQRPAPVNLPRAARASRVMQLLALCLVAGLGVPAAASGSGGQPAESDTLVWLDDYQAALALAQETGRPLLVEFRCAP